MKYSFTFLATVAAVAASPYPQAVTKAIAPSASAPAGCSNTYSGSFGLVYYSVLTQGQQASKRAVVTQIGDGQIQAPTYGAAPGTTSLASPSSSAAASPSSLSRATSAAAVPTSLSRATSVAAVSASSSKPSSAAAVPASSPRSPSVGAGNSPASSSRAGSSSVAAGAAPSSISGLRILPPVTQINDGQIQAPRLTSSPAAVGTSGAQSPRSSSTAVGATGAGPAPAASSSSRASVASNAATTSQRASSAAASSSSFRAASSSVAAGTSPRSATAAVSASPSRATGTAASRISDGQIQAPTGQTSPSSNNIGACAANGVLTLTLSNGVLKDARGWTGYIASNNQFQFDNPPQSGSIYTAGWSVCGNGSLALGGSAQFWQCLSGGFYNLYNANIAPQCSPITLNAAKLVQC